MSNAREGRYRRLALASDDQSDADLLLKLACDRGLLCTAKWASARPHHENEAPPKAGNDRMRFAWDPSNNGR